jgi:hypothetical protein
LPLATEDNAGDLTVEGKEDLEHEEDGGAAAPVPVLIGAIAEESALDVVEESEVAGLELGSVFVGSTARGNLGALGGEHVLETAQLCENAALGGKRGAGCGSGLGGDTGNRASGELLEDAAVIAGTAATLTRAGELGEEGELLNGESGNTKSFRLSSLSLSLLQLLISSSSHSPSPSLSRRLGMTAGKGGSGVVLRLCVRVSGRNKYVQAPLTLTSSG